MTEAENIEDAIEFIAMKLGDVDDFRIDYSTMNDGERYITICCNQPIRETEQSRFDKYKLESMELGQSTIVTLSPQKL